MDFDCSAPNVDASDDERRLLNAYRAGETWAFEILYNLYADRIRRFLAGGFTFVSRGRPCRYRGNAPGIDAEAIVQETFSRVFAPSTRSHYDGERPFKNYLLSIAKNLVLREVSRKERVVSIEQADETTDVLARKHPEAPSGFQSDEHDPEVAVSDAQLARITRAFINTLTDEERSFFNHRFVHGLTQEATAAAMGATRARVKLLEKNQRDAFMLSLRTAGYFVGYAPKARWARHTA